MKWIVAIVLAVLLGNAAHAAGVRLETPETDTSPAVVTVTGRFIETDYDALVGVTEQIKQATGVFHSLGDELAVGDAIGNHARDGGGEGRGVEQWSAFRLVGYWEQGLGAWLAFFGTTEPFSRQGAGRSQALFLQQCNALHADELHPLQISRGDRRKFPEHLGNQIIIFFASVN
jgi:hypothetical protein